jgi:hypothetical protein
MKKYIICIKDNRVQYIIKQLETGLVNILEESRQGFTTIEIKIRNEMDLLDLLHAGIRIGTLEFFTQ